MALITWFFRDSLPMLITRDIGVISIIQPAMIPAIAMIFCSANNAVESVLLGYKDDKFVAKCYIPAVFAGIYIKRNTKTFIWFNWCMVEFSYVLCNIISTVFI